MSSGGQILAVLGTGHLTQPDELDDLSRLCQKPDLPDQTPKQSGQDPVM